MDLKQLRAAVTAALQSQRQVSAAVRSAGPSGVPLSPAPPPGGVQALARIVGDSPAMEQIRHRIEKVATSMAPVLILGESGTGKELVARAVHECSHRSSSPFVAVNCGAIPDNLIEAEFFGARKGAYTGASQDREGYFQAAKGGTLFLDEIGDLPLAMQAKLLRVIQERRVRPLGGVQEEAVDVRLVSATHRDLAALVKSGRLSARPFLPPQRHRPAHPAPARTPGRPAAARPGVAGAHLQRIGSARAPSVAAGRAPGCKAASWRATCASWKTCCSARWP